MAKRPRGLVELRIGESPGAYEVEVKDDGRGIDLALVARRAIDRGLATEATIAAMPDGGLSLIFVDGVSTAETTTTISGRGIGLSAVKSATEAAGGRITIHNDPGAGTTFVLHVPKLGGPRGPS